MRHAVIEWKEEDRRVRLLSRRRSGSEESKKRMAEQHSKPRAEEPEKRPEEAQIHGFVSSRQLLPFGLGLILLLAGCFMWGNQSPDSASPDTLATPALT